MPCTVHTHLVVAVVERGRVGSLETRAHGVGRRAGVAQDRVCVRGNVRVAEGIDSLPSSFPSYPCILWSEMEASRGEPGIICAFVFLSVFCV